jgi:hypothetical protein
MNWYNKFKAGLFTKSQFLVGVALTTLITSALVFAYNIIGHTNFMANNPISATDMNNRFNKINDALSAVGDQFTVGMTSNQSFSSTDGTYSTAIDLQLATVISDFTQNGFGSSLVNYQGFTIQNTGAYEITLSGRTTSGMAQVGVWVNANTTVHMGSFGTSAPFSWTPISKIVELDAGDSITLRIQSWSSGTVDGSKTKFTFKKIH